MKTFATYLFLGTYLVSSRIAVADCVFPIPRHWTMRIESCSNPLEIALSTIDGKGYTDLQVSEVKLAAGNLSIVHATGLAEVDIILWYSSGNQRIFKGKVRPIPDSIPTRFVLLATSVEDCKKNYLGKVHMFEPFSSTHCRDQIGDGFKETDAAELTNLPALTPFWGEHQLESAPRRLLDALR